MKFRHYFFLVLKILLGVQFLLILLNKESVSSTTYLVTEILFKTSIGVFMNIFIFYYKIEGLLFEDKVLISIAGGLLMYDAWVTDFPQLMDKIIPGWKFPL